MFITSLELIDSSGNVGVPLDTLTDGQTIDMTFFGTTEFSIRAYTIPENDPSAKVDWTEENDTPGGILTDSFTANGPPYSVQGANNNDRYTTSTTLSTPGTYTVTAVFRKNGFDPDTVTMTFTVVA